MSAQVHTPADARGLKHALHVVADGGLVLGRGATLSRARLDTVGAVAPESMTLSAGAGVSLGRVERELAAQGLTLGPLPPGALELELWAFVEGPLAGLRSIPFGRLEPVTARLKGMLADGTVVETSPGPRSATGPDLAALFLGGAGRLGLLTEATVRGYPQPTDQVERRAEFPTARALVDAVRGALADGLWPARLSLAGSGATARAAAHLWGSVGQVRREVATWEHAVARAGGHASVGVPLGPVAGPLIEATWEEVERALTQGQALELSRPSLASVLVCGQVVGLRLDAPAPWALPAGLLTALDARGLLGGAP